MLAGGRTCAGYASSARSPGYARRRRPRRGTQCAMSSRYPAPSSPQQRLLVHVCRACALRCKPRPGARRRGASSRPVRPRRPPRRRGQPVSARCAAERRHRQFGGRPPGEEDRDGRDRPPVEGAPRIRDVQRSEHVRRKRHPADVHLSLPRLILDPRSNGSVAVRLGSTITAGSARSTGRPD